MGEPPFYLESVLHSIESVAVSMHHEFSRLTDDDIEIAYERLMKYYKSRMSNKDTEEPEVSSDRRQAVIDEILNIIELREEENADIDYINNPDVRHGEHTIPSLERLYIMAFKRLIKSVRFWRKEHGKKGYLNYIGNFFI